VELHGNGDGNGAGDDVFEVTAAAAIHREDV
jgi:hypothetical protein